MKPGLRVLAVTVFCVLVEHDEVIEQSHRRARWDGIGFLVHRQARRGVEGVHAQYAAQLLRAGRASHSRRRQRCTCRARTPARKAGFSDWTISCGRLSRPCQTRKPRSNGSGPITHKIAQNRLALGGEESVCVGHRQQPLPGQSGEPTHAHLHHRQ